MLAPSRLAPVCLLTSATGRGAFYSFQMKFPHVVVGGIDKTQPPMSLSAEKQLRKQYLAPQCVCVCVRGRTELKQQVDCSVVL